MPIVPPLNTDSYLNFDELTAYLKSISEAVPHLVRVFSLGNSMGGRALWVAEVTNTNTGAARSKPAVWIDGNIDGSQYSTSVSCLGILQRLASEHGRSPFITDLLDTKTFYIAPRLAPDGAELSLTSGLVTSAGRRLGFFDGLREGLVPGDINGDGRILQMRREDPLGHWKACEEDPRIMLRREPGDIEGRFYSLYREGFFDVDTNDPLRLRLVDCKRDLCNDFTPSCGSPNKHYGGSGTAGPFSQIESRLISGFLRSLNNICLAVSFRSGTGRIQISADESAVSQRDRKLFKILASKASELTDHIPVYECKESTDFADWLYMELGIPCLRVDSWNVFRKNDEFDSLEKASFEAQKQMMLHIMEMFDCCEAEGQGRGFVDWTECDHPSLGKVEVGGWDVAAGWINPPAGSLLKEICESHIDMALRLAAALPKINLGRCSDTVVGWAEPDEDGDELIPLRIISAEILNEGYLPAWISERGKSKDEPLISEISLEDGMELLMGSALCEDEPLDGIVSLFLRPLTNLGFYGYRASEENSADLEMTEGSPFFSGCSERSRCIKRWLIKGKGEAVVSVCHPRCGAVQYATGGGCEVRSQFKLSKPSAVIPSSEAPAAMPYAAVGAAIVASGLTAGMDMRASQPSGIVSAPKASAPARSQIKSAQMKSQQSLRNSGEFAAAAPAAPAKPAVIKASAEPVPEEAAPQIRTVNLTEMTSKSNLQKASAQPAHVQVPKAPEPEEEYRVPSSRAGYRPTVSGGMQRPPVQTVNPSSSLRSDFARPTVSASQSSSLRKTGSSDSAPAALIKGSNSDSRRSVQPSGRVLGQPPARQGVQTGTRNDAPSRPVPRSADLTSPAEYHEVRPHPLIPSKVQKPPEPQEPVPDIAVPSDDLMESPPAPSAPQLLRRSRGDE